MNIVLDPNMFIGINIFFLDKKKNNVIDGYFSKIIYSSELFIMNGISLVLPFVFDEDASNHRSDFYTKPNKPFILRNSSVVSPEKLPIPTLVPSSRIATIADDANDNRKPTERGTSRESILVAIPTLVPSSVIGSFSGETTDEFRRMKGDTRYNVYYYTHHLTNLQYIATLTEIENSIINTYKEIYSIKKNNNLGLSNQLHKGYFKIYKDRKHTLSQNMIYPTDNKLLPDTHTKYILKISGVWENMNEVGITYKFIEMSSV